MGDRGNIAIIQSDNDQVWLYSHWGGSELPQDVQDGLRAGKGRWEDESYLAKIIIGHAVACTENSWHGETGWGISCRIQDNSYPILVVNIPRKQVFTILEGELDNFKVPKGYQPRIVGEAGPWTFDEYIALEKPMWSNLKELEPA